MANTTYMSMPVNVIDVTPDPDWSENDLTSQGIIDGHDHITIGKPITTEALDIDADLSLGGFNLTDVRTVQLQNLSDDPDGDIVCPYGKDGDLWYNNGSGGHVQITSGSGLNVSVGAANIFSSQSSSVNITILNTDQYTYLKLFPSTTLNVFLPDAALVGNGRFYFISDSNGTSETNTINIVPAGSNTINGVNALYPAVKNYGTWFVISEGGEWKLNPLMTQSMSNGSFNSPSANIILNAFGNIWATQVNNAAFGLSGVDGYAEIDANQLSIFAPTTISNSLSVTGAIGTTSTTAHYTLGTRSNIRQQLGLKLPIGGTWAVSFGVIYTASTASATLLIPLQLPHGATLTGCDIHVKGAAGHSVLPDLPAYQLIKYDQNFSGTSIGSAAIDPSTTIGAYQVPHTIPLTGLSTVVDNSINTYYLQLIGEGTTNFVSGFQVLGVSATCSVSSIDEG